MKRLLPLSKCPDLNLTNSGLAAMNRGPIDGGLAFAQGPRGGMRRFAWLRVLLPGLCAGLIPACLSPAPGPGSGPSPYVRSGKPAQLAATPEPILMPPIARPAAPEESLTRIGYQTDAGRPPLVGGVSATGMPLRPREETNPDKPQPVLLASAVERRPA